MPTNDFKAIAIGGGANVLTQAEYIALTSLLSDGFQAGVATSKQFNKVWRQSAFIAAALAQTVCDLSSSDVLDDGNLSGLVTKIKAVIAAAGSLAPVPTRAITHLTPTPTVALSDGELWCNTSGGDIIITAPLGVVPSGFTKSVPVLMAVGGGDVILTRDGTIATEFGRVINEVDGSGAGCLTVHLGNASVFATGNQ